MSDVKTDTVIHNLVPKHEVLSADEKAELVKKYPAYSIPKIHIGDPAIKIFGLDVAIGDVIRISRKDITGKHFYYRIVIK